MRLSHASSKPRVIWKKEAWKARKEAACLHEEWEGYEGIMYCKKCGKARMPSPWEDAGLPPLLQPLPGDPEKLNIRTEGSEGDL